MASVREGEFFTTNTALQGRGGKAGLPRELEERVERQQRPLPSSPGKSWGLFDVVGAG